MCEELNRKEFHEAIDTTLSGLQADPWLAQRVVYRERKSEPVARKKIPIAVIIALITILLSAVAIAAGIVFSRNVATINKADNALEYKYGITLEMQTYFNRYITKDDEYSIVHYDSYDPFAYVLGNYTVIIKGDKADACWSRDGVDTNGGFDADAWGATQLKEMLRITQEEHDISYFRNKAISINESLIASCEKESYPAQTANPANFYMDQQLIQSAEIGLSEISFSNEEMMLTAIEVISNVYSLNKEQISHLLFQEDSSFYILYGKNKTPCYRVYFSLGFEEDGYEGVGSGIYIVIINLADGSVEDIYYDSALSGNG